MYTWRGAIASTVLVAVAFVIFGTVPARSENLNKKYGDYWNCSYISAGESSYTPCMRCQNQNMDYDDSGTCIPRSGSTAAAPPPPVARPTPQYSAPTQQRVLWGAVAGGLWRNSDGIAQVSVGSAVRYSSESAAKSAALGQCSSGGGQNCEVAGTFTACGYITTGRNNGNSGSAGWVSSGTSAGATSSCQAKYANCKTPIGGCN